MTHQAILDANSINICVYSDTVALLWGAEPLDGLWLGRRRIRGRFAQLKWEPRFPLIRRFLLLQFANLQNAWKIPIFFRSSLEKSHRASNETAEAGVLLMVKVVMAAFRATEKTFEPDRSSVSVPEEIPSRSAIGRHSVSRSKIDTCGQSIAPVETAEGQISAIFLRFRPENQQKSPPENDPGELTLLLRLQSITPVSPSQGGIIQVWRRPSQ